MNNPLFVVASICACVVVAGGLFLHQLIPSRNVEYLPAMALCSSLSHPPSIVGEAGFVFDIKKGEALFSKNEYAPLPLASLTKLMTVFIASERLSPDYFVTITEEMLLPEGDSGLIAGEILTVEFLKKLSLIESSNDASRALALAVGEGSFPTFVDIMNTTASAHQLVQTYFLNDTGLDVSGETAGAYGSAYDVAQLLTLLMREHPDILFDSNKKSETLLFPNGRQREVVHTSALPGIIHGGVTFKTGFTDLAGGNLAGVVEVFPGHPVAFVVLGSTHEMREEDMFALITFARDMLRRATLCGVWSSM